MKKCIIPAFVFFVVSLCVMFMQNPPAIAPLEILGFLASCLVYNGIAQILAYLTCRYLVIEKGKGNREIWVNYIVWTLIMNLGTVAVMLNTH